MSSSLSSSSSAMPTELPPPTGSPLSSRSRQGSAIPRALKVVNAVTALETTTSVNNQAFFSCYQLGSTIIAHSTSATGAPLLTLFQIGYYDRHTHEWISPKIRKRYVHRQPDQQSPLDHTFDDLSGLSPEPDQAGGRLQGKTPVFEQQAPGVQHHFLNPPSRIPSSTPGPVANQTPVNGDITSTFEALVRRVEEFSLCVQSQHSGVQGHRRGRPLMPAPPPPPSVRGLPTVHPQLLVNCSPAASNHSRSRSRSRSREHNASVRSRKIYEAIDVPCPFSDNRQSMLPAARAKGSAPMRKLYRQVLGGSRVTKDRLVASRGSTYKAATLEEQMLLNYAHLVDLFLLEANSGSWTLWSEPGVDWLVRSFLEMAIRSSPKSEPRLFLDPYLAGRIRRLKYGKNHSFGLLATPPFKKGTTPPSL